MRIVIASLGLLFVLGCLATVGCGPPASQDVVDQRYSVKTENMAKDPFLFAHQLEALGFEGEVYGTVGDGHLMGQAFNLMGTHLGFKIVVKPHAATQPTSQPATLGTMEDDSDFVDNDDDPRPSVATHTMHVLPESGP